MINLSRKNQPRYLFKLSVALVSFFAFWFTAVVAVMVAVGCIYGENVITYAVMGGGFGLFAVGLVIFFILDKTFYNRNILKLTAELEKEFTDMPFEEAERILKERGVIDERGFIVNDGVFGGETVPFKNAYLTFNIDITYNVEMKISLYEKGGDSPKTVYVFDGAAFNYFCEKETNLKYNEALMLLKRNKREFTESISRYSKIFKWEF